MIGRRERSAGPLAWWIEGEVFGAALNFASATIVAVGPWIVAVTVLQVLSSAVTPTLDEVAIEDFRLSVVYGFALALLASAPLGAVGGRLVRSAAEERDGRFVTEIFISCSIAAAVLAYIMAGFATVALGVGPIGMAHATVVLAASAALIWTSFAGLAALGQYGFLLRAFMAGMAASVAVAAVTVRLETTVEDLVWTFTAGLLVCVFLCVQRVRRLYPARDGDAATGAWVLLGALLKLRVLAFGVLLAVCGVWADKLVFWFGEVGLVSQSGFRHFPFYDTAMFVAHLSIVPTFAAMLLLHEGPLKRAVDAFQDTVESRAAFPPIANAARGVGETLWSEVALIVAAQLAVSACVVMLAPLIAQRMDFSFSQFETLRIGVIAVLVQSIFYINVAIVVICNRSHLFMILQLGFILLNLSSTIAFSMYLGSTAFGLLSSSIVMVVVSFYYAFQSLEDYMYLYFVGENESLYQEASQRRAAAILPDILALRLANALGHWDSARRRPAHEE